MFLLDLISQTIVVEQPLQVEVSSVVSQYEDPLVIERPDIVECSCVQTARKYASVDVPKGDADMLEPNGPPVIGGLILLRYGEVSHVEVILAFMDKGYLTIGGNYERCKILKRIIPYDDEAIVGFRAM